MGETGFDPAAHGWRLRDDEGFIAHVGPFWERTGEDGVPRFAFLADARHENLRGVVQGGMVMTALDRAMGVTCWHINEWRPQATVQLDVHFVDAVRIGDFVEAEVGVVRRTRSLTFLEGALLVDGRTVATGKGIWKALKPPPA